MSATVVQPYLTFGGRCEEALEFYRKAVGAKVDAVMFFKDAPEPPPSGMLAPGFENKVMHAAFRIGSSTVMASDGCGPDSRFDGFSLSLMAPTVDDAKKLFEALSDGGKVTLPMGPTFWSPCFGMLLDRFGVSWMVIVLTEPCPG